MRKERNTVLFFGKVSSSTLLPVNDKISSLSKAARSTFFVKLSPISYIYKCIKRRGFSSFQTACAYSEPSFVFHASLLHHSLNALLLEASTIRAKVATSLSANTWGTVVSTWIREVSICQPERTLISVISQNLGFISLQ